MNIYICCLLGFCLSGCTSSISFVNTDGAASDVIDGAQTAQPSVTIPNISGLNVL